MEVNASDTRNKADSKIVAGIGGRKSNVVKELATNAAIGVDAQGSKIKVSPPGLSAGSQKPLQGKHKLQLLDLL